MAGLVVGLLLFSAFALAPAEAKKDDKKEAKDDKKEAKDDKKEAKDDKKEKDKKDKGKPGDGDGTPPPPPPPPPTNNSTTPPPPPPPTNNSTTPPPPPPPTNNSTSPPPTNNSTTSPPPVGPPPPAGPCARNAETRGSATVAFTFDDGSRDHYEASQTLLSKGMCGTFYIISQDLRQEPYYTDFLSAGEVQKMAADGHDIESHTVTHPDLTTVPATKIEQEMRDSQAQLEAITGKPVRHIAYPYGASNAAVETAAAKYYDSGRAYYSGLNEVQDAGTRYHVAALGLEATTTLDMAKSYVDWAMANNRTLVLILHTIGGTDQYSWPASDYAALLDYVAAADVNVRTIAQLAAAGALPA